MDEDGQEGKKGGGRREEVGRGTKERSEGRMRGPGSGVKHSEKEQAMNELTVTCQLESFSGWW